MSFSRDLYTHGIVSFPVQDIFFRLTDIVYDLGRLFTFLFLYWGTLRDTRKRGHVESKLKAVLCKKQTLNINASANLTSSSPQKENAAHFEVDLSSGEH